MLEKCKIICALLAVGALTAGASAEIVVGFDPEDTTIDPVGGTALVDIVADIPETEPVLSWGLDVTVANPAIASWTLVSIGPLWYPIESPDGDNLGGLAFPDSVWGDDTLLATLEFTGLSLGLTEIGMCDDYPADLTEGFALDPSGFADVTYCCGTVEVVPEPASLSLLALCGLLAVRRR
jgi:hypothetical protein